MVSDERRLTMQCSSCVFYRYRDCTNVNAEEEWLELAEVGECPGYYGKEDACYDNEVRFAEKG